MPLNFIRKIAVQVGEIYTDKLDIDFETSSKVIDEGTGSTATITIWNLSKPTAAKIKTGQLVKLWAGYADDYGIIYLGRVIETTSKKDGADIAYKISCKDYTYPASIPSRTYPKGTPIRQILQQVYSDCAIPAGELINDCGVTLGDAHTTNTNALTEIETCISIINGDPDVTEKVHHVIIGGSACVISDKQTTASTHALKASTGLIETAADTSDESDQTASVLLNWRISVDSQIYLESSNTTGYYKVVGCKHTHDGDTYKTDLTLASMEAA